VGVAGAHGAELLDDAGEHGPQGSQ
jgi:hypothetical protein